MAAATIMRLQTLVSREVAGTDTAVVTVGAVNAGTKANIIPDDAELLLNIRSYDEARAGATCSRPSSASCGPSPRRRAPTDARHRGVRVGARGRQRPGCRGAHPARARSVVGAGRVVDPGAVTGSEDVGVLAAAAGAPLVYWLLGGADPAAFAGASTAEQLMRVVAGLPSNHSPQFAPVEDPTLRIGVEALVAAATEWLAT